MARFDLGAGVRALAASSMLVACGALSACGGAQVSEPVATAGSPAPQSARQVVHDDRSIVDFGHAAAGSEVVAVAKVIGAYNNAIATRDGSRACDALSSAMRAQARDLLSAAASQARRRSCAEIVAGLFGAESARDLRALRHTSITGVRLDGDHGFALFHRAGVGDGFFPVVREHGRWKTAALSGSIQPLP